MSVPTSILDEKAIYGGTLGAHSGHKLNLVQREYYDSSTVTFVHDYGIDCDMYEGCGAMILDNLQTRQEALEIMAVIDAAKPQTMFPATDEQAREWQEYFAKNKGVWTF